MFKDLRSLFMAAAVLIGFAAAASAQGSPQDYPQWRGRNRDGAASGFKEPKAWPEKLTRRWKVEVGEGYATPIVVGKTVYAFTRRTARNDYGARRRDRQAHLADRLPGSIQGR